MADGKQWYNDPKGGASGKNGGKPLDPSRRPSRPGIKQTGKRPSGPSGRLSGKPSGRTPVNASGKPAATQSIKPTGKAQDRAPGKTPGKSSGILIPNRSEPDLRRNVL